MRRKKWRQCSYIDHTNAKVLTASVCCWAMEGLKMMTNFSSHHGKTKFYKNRFSFSLRSSVVVVHSLSLKDFFSVSFSMSSNLSTAKVDSKVASYNQKPSFWTLWNHDIWTFVVLLDRGSLRNYLEKVTSKNVATWGLETDAGCRHLTILIVCYYWKEGKRLYYSLGVEKLLQ